jgi:hypothetical protein
MRLRKANVMLESLKTTLKQSANSCSGLMRGRMWGEHCWWVKNFPNGKFMPNSCDKHPKITRSGNFT